MPRFFVKKDQVIDDLIIIKGEDVKHIKNVIRKQIGDILEICNQDNGKAYKCKIVKFEETQIVTQILNELEDQNKDTDDIKIDIYQGLPKSDKMELIIQKSVELGANAIIPVEMKRCVVKIDSKSENKKIERWQKIAESAAKQCGRSNIPEIRNILKIQDISKLAKQYDAILVAYENEKENYIKKELKILKEKYLTKGRLDLAIVIGPEGGLEESEVQLLKENGSRIISLGNRILRTETVALNVLSIIMYEFDKNV